jgi:hypothetical protein
MNFFSIAAAAIALLVGWLVFRDIREDKIGILKYLIDRHANPISYWLLIGMEITILLFCLLLTLAFAVLPPRDCDDDGKCQITIELRRT